MMIAGLANFYRGFILLLVIIFGVATVVGLIGFLDEIGDRYRSTENIAISLSFLASGVLGIIGCGAIAVLLDIMDNIRDIKGVVQGGQVNFSGLDGSNASTHSDKQQPSSNLPPPPRSKADLSSRLDKLAQEASDKKGED